MGILKDTLVCDLVSHENEGHHLKCSHELHQPMTEASSVILKAPAHDPRRVDIYAPTKALLM